MSAAHTTRTAFRLTGWHVLAIVTGFFALVTAVDIGFVVMAVRTFPGEVSSTPYEDGLAYDRSLAQLRAHLPVQGHLPPPSDRRPEEHGSQQQAHGDELVLLHELDDLLQGRSPT